MPKTKKNKQLGWGLVIYGLLFAGTGFAYLGDDTSALLIIGGILCVFAGIIMLFSLKKSEKLSNLEHLNKTFFSLVEKNKGRITVVQFASASNLDIPAAREFIESKSVHLSVSPEIDDDGTIYYIFK
jgi:large subunit ribosomal protein L7/L12